MDGLTTASPAVHGRVAQFSRRPPFANRPTRTAFLARDGTVANVVGAQGQVVPAAVADHVDQVLHGVQRAQRRSHGHHVLPDILVLRRRARAVVPDDEHRR